jgi:hypothetical protein
MSKRRKPTLTIRMGAAHWDVVAHAADPVRIDLRGLSDKDFRKVVFEVVRACREQGLVTT